MAAFGKMVGGEELTLLDAQRVWQIVLQNGMKIDTRDENALAQFRSELKGNIQRVLFT